MWDFYKVTLRFQNRLCGGIPKHPGVIKSWLEARAPSEAALERREQAGEEITPIEELAEEVAGQVYAPTPEEQMSKVWAGFKHDEGMGLYVDGSHFKSHLKDCATVLSRMLDIKAFKAKLANRLFVVEDQVPLGKAEPDGFWEHPVHVILPGQGPRSALKRTDYVHRPTLTLHLKVLSDGMVTRKTLEQLLEYGETHGFGAERGLGNGRYEWELVAEPSPKST